MVFITGATGYIGRKLLQTELLANQKVVALARPGAKTFPRPNLTWLEGDVLHLDPFQHIIKEAQLIVHLAAYVHLPTATPAQQQQCWAINFEATKQLIDLAMANPTPPFFIFLSTTAVYGSHPFMIDEETIPTPQTAYGQSKLKAEQYLLNQLKTGRIEGCILQPCMIYGQNAPGNFQTLLKLAHYGWMPILDKGQNQKSLVAIEHVLWAIQLCLNNPQLVNAQKYIVTDGPPLTLAEMIDLIQKNTPHPVRLVPFSSRLIKPLVTLWDSCAKFFSGPLLTPRLEIYGRTDIFSNQKLCKQLNFYPLKTTELFLQDVIRSFFTKDHHL